MKRWHSLVAAAAVVGVAVAGASGGPQEPDDDTIMVTTARGTTTGYGPFAFTVAGSSIKGLYPGVVKDMTVTLTNPYDFDIAVQSMHGAVVASSNPRCKPGPATLTTRPFTGKLPLIVKAGARQRVGAVPVAMPKGASAKCQKTTFTIQLTGTAKKAAR
ncbi:hypothetical protein [Spirilliplanes yamanashiensis]|uniref:Uncharacterized protein n=1 Tax=Spirilliplanes yamanashiensis TaxID=42233 RepID=A0A8J3Y3W0_9ACTN|nr:hypothetical protein [Spirilliplanes yamanashiensis]MDP9814043.1 hypothetical protein [Spirilliplanes yamanashiensis]GIJ00977.1 hypothetical protein Sya03_03290 [Spirilliplanes yamanashiensis]